MLPAALRSSTRLLIPRGEALLQEPCILVDENDVAVGQASKRECHMRDASGNSPLHRAFSLFVFNDKDELLMQQRSKEKITFPALWTNTCCSHPLAVPDEKEVADGMGAKRAAQRRIKSELGVEPDECPVEHIEYLTRILYRAPSSGGRWQEHELDYILLLRQLPAGMTVRSNPNEVMATEYVRREDLGEFIRAANDKAGGTGITPWFDLIAHSMLPEWWKNLGRIEAYKDHQAIKKFY